MVSLYSMTMEHKPVAVARASPPPPLNMNQSISLCDISAREHVESFVTPN